MTDAEIADLILQIVTGLLVVGIVPLIRAIRKLEVGQVELKKDVENTKERVEHVRGNYQQGIDHLNSEMARMYDDLSEIKTDIKELLRHRTD